MKLPAYLKVKKTIQIRYPLIPLKEAHNLVKCEHVNLNVSVGFSKFCYLRPHNIKLFDQFLIMCVFVCIMKMCT